MSIENIADLIKTNVHHDKDMKTGKIASLKVKIHKLEYIDTKQGRMVLLSGKYKYNHIQIFGMAGSFDNVEKYLVGQKNSRYYEQNKGYYFTDGDKFIDSPVISMRATEISSMFFACDEDEYRYYIYSPVIK